MGPGCPQSYLDSHLRTYCFAQKVCSTSDVHGKPEQTLLDRFRLPMAGADLVFFSAD